MDVDNSQIVKSIEELSLNAWSSLQTKLYDGWVLRFANGYTKRSNSISSLYESKIELDEKFNFCEKQYEFCNLPVIYKITPECSPKDIDQRLEARGYIKVDETSVRVLDISQYQYSESKEVVVETHFSNRWTEGFFECSNLSDINDQLTARKIYENICGEVICVAKQINNEIVGCGFGAIERGYIGIYDIVVDKKHRGNGYGKDIVNSILCEAYKKNVKTAYLSVVVGNTPAEKLYHGLGFSEVYRYWYRKLEI